MSDREEIEEFARQCEGMAGLHSNPDLMKYWLDRAALIRRLEKERDEALSRSVKAPESKRPIVKALKEVVGGATVRELCLHAAFDIEELERWNQWPLDNKYRAMESEVARLRKERDEARNKALDEAAAKVTEHYQSLCTEHRLLLVDRANAILALKSPATEPTT